GSIVPFGGKPFDKVVAKDRGRQYRVKAFTLPDVQVGSILDYRFNIRYADHWLYAPEWILQGDLFQKKESFKFTFYQGRYTLAWSMHLPIGPKPEMHNYPHAGTDAQRRTAMDWVGLDMVDARYRGAIFAPVQDFVLSRPVLLCASQQERRFLERGRQALE